VTGVLGAVLAIAAFALFLGFWLSTVFHLWLRHDLSGLQKAVWFAVVLLVPFVGAVVYWLVLPPSVRRFRF
jgi:hypothetical protein